MEDTRLRRLNSNLPLPHSSESLTAWMPGNRPRRLQQPAPAWAEMLCPKSEGPPPARRGPVAFRMPDTFSVGPVMPPRAPRRGSGKGEPRPRSGGVRSSPHHRLPQVPPTRRLPANGPRQAVRAGAPTGVSM